MYKLGYNTGGKYGYCNNKFITKNAKQIFLITAIVFSISFLIIPMQEAVAGVLPPTIVWGVPAGYTIDSGELSGSTFPITFEVYDPALDTNAMIDTIDVVLTSRTFDSTIIDSTTLSLTESVDDGMFTNSILIFTHDPAEYLVTDTITITIEDDCSFGTGNCDSGSVDVLTGAIDGVVVVSTTPGSGIVIDLTETGEDTDIFTRVLKFSTVGPSDSGTATLHVSPGDVFTIFDVSTAAAVNALIIPSPGDVGSITAEVDGTVTASYGGVSVPVSVLDDGAGGRGSGGLLRPGLVLNFAASISQSTTSGCTGDCTNPTLGLDANNNRIVDKGFSYNGFAEDVMDFYTPYPLITTNVGQENVAVLKIYENGGPENIKHVSLAFGLSHGGESISQSKAIIKWDRTFFGFETVTVEDPENALQDVSVEATTGPCSPNSVNQCLILTIYHTFREYLGFNIVGTDVWDYKLNSETNFYNDGVEVVGESMNPPKQFRVQDSRGHLAIVTQTDKDAGLDDEGNTWTLINNIWLKDYVPPEIISDTVNSHGVDRNNNMFKTYFDGQILVAQEYLDQQMSGITIQNPDFDKANNFGSIPSNFDIDEYEDLLQKRILNEQARAEELFCILYNIKPLC